MKVCSKAKIKKNNFILIVIIFLGLLGVSITLGPRLTSSLKNSIKKESITTKRLNFKDYTSEKYGEWSFNATWDAFTDDSVTANYEPSANDMYENEFPLVLNLEYTGGATSAIASGELKYYLPVNVFKIFDDKEYYYEPSPDSNELLVYRDINEVSTQVGAVYMGDICYVSLSEGCDFLWDFDESTNELYVTNNNEIDTVNTISYNYSIAYDFLPSEIQSEVEKNSQVKVCFDNCVESFVSNDVYATVKTGGSFSNETQKKPVVYETWDSNWGINDLEDDSTYYYVEYVAYLEVAATQKYSLDIVPKFNDGEIVAYYDGSNYKTGNLTAFLNDKDKFNPFGDYIDSTASKIKDEVPSNPLVTRGFIVRYARDMSGKEVTNTFNLQYNLVGESLASAEKEFTFEQKYKNTSGLVDPEYPSGDNNEAQQEISDDNVGVGAINKLNNNENINLNLNIEATSSPMNVDINGQYLKGFNNFNITEKGIKNYKLELVNDKLVLDKSYNSVVSEKKLQKGDYKILSFYPFGDSEYYYTNSDEHREYYLNENVIDNYTDKDVYVEINGNSWQKIGSYKKDSNGNINYIALDDKTTSVNNVSSSNPIILPDNTTNVKISYDGSQASVYMGISLNIQLLASNNMKDLLNSFDKEDSVVLKNYISVIVNDEKKTTSNIGTYLTKLNKSSSLNSKVSFNRLTTNDGVKNNIIDYSIKMYQEIDSSDSLLSLSKNLLKEEQNGKFYFLLPLGASLDGNVVATPVASDVTTNVNVSNIDNFADTGRTMIVLDLTNDKSGNYLLENQKLLTGFNINLSIAYSQISNRDYGNNLVSDLVYSSSNELENGYNDAKNALSSLFSSDDVKNKLSNIDSINDKNNKLFITNSLEIAPVTVVVGDAYTTVKGPGDNDYGKQTKVYEAGKYRYKLQYVYSDVLTNINHLVLFDALDSYPVNQTAWNGELLNVDTSYLEKTLGIKPTIYYSTIEKLDFSESKNVDLSKENVWTVDKPKNLSTVKAIAIDCGDYEFTGTDIKIPIVYVDMLASLNYDKLVTSNDDVYAYNNVAVKFSNVGSNTYTIKESEATKVSLMKSSIKMNAVAKNVIDGTEFASGSMDAPTRIDKELGYLISVSNQDLVSSYNNIVVNDLLPSGLELDASKITYYTGDDVSNKKLISDDNLIKYSYNASDNSLNLIVSEIKAGEKINLWVPVNVDPTNLNSDNAIFVNKIALVKIEDRAYRGQEFTLYNSILMPGISAKHYVSVSGSAGYVDTENEAITVNRGDSYTYMIKLNNDKDVDAAGVKVIENVPSGLDVDESSISSSGIYDKQAGTITWDISSLAALSSMELIYKVTVPNDAPNNTRYVSKAHITLKNPYDNTKNVYDKDTNTIITIYKTATDLVINNKVAGKLADQNKKFSYEIIFEGKEYAAGEYEVLDTNSKKVGVLSIDNNGSGSYTYQLSDGEKLRFKDLAGEMNFKIIQKQEKGYTSSITDKVVTIESGNASIIGVTSEEKILSYEFVNEYSAQTTFIPMIKTTYDNGLEDDMFKVTLDVKAEGSTYSETKTNDVNGYVKFSEITYKDEIGTYVYSVKELEGDNERILYDSNHYTIVVKVTDNKDGTLNKEISYYDKYDNKLNVDTLEFKNEFIKVGLLVSNVFEGDYINPKKEFNYQVTVETDNVNDGNYKVYDKNNTELDDFIIKEGKGSYEFNLKSDEIVLISELPVGATYKVVEKMEDYYTSKIDGSPYLVDDETKTITHNGVITLSTKKVNFKNLYETKANFLPNFKMELQDKELTNDEFSFLIKDVSAISTGYGEVVTNNLDGNIIFSSINFTKPGTYLFEITQLRGNSNHIYYDESKAYLELVLIDNEDGTMSVTPTYRYDNNFGKFINKYSESPIYSDGTNGTIIDKNTNNGINNPNTKDYFIIVIVIGMMSMLFFIVHRVIKVRKFSN